MNVGAFYFSESTMKRLKKYREEKFNNKSRSWVGYLDTEIEVTRSCLKDIINIARNELKIK